MAVPAPDLLGREFSPVSAAIPGARMVGDITYLAAKLYAAIRSAILDEQQVVAEYQGHLRELCPHANGTKNGRAQALFYLFAGGSAWPAP